jgi:hypothetical protein
MTGTTRQQQEPLPWSTSQRPTILVRPLDSTWPPAAAAVSTLTAGASGHGLRQPASTQPPNSHVRINSQCPAVQPTSFCTRLRSILRLQSVSFQVGATGAEPRAVDQLAGPTMNALSHLSSISAIGPPRAQAIRVTCYPTGSLPAFKLSPILLLQMGFNHRRQPAPLNDHLSIFSNNCFNFYYIVNIIIL